MAFNKTSRSIRSTNPSTTAPAAMLLSFSAMLVAVCNGVMTSSHQQVGILILSQYVMKKQPCIYMHNMTQHTPLQQVKEYECRMGREDPDERGGGDKLSRLLLTGIILCYYLQAQCYRPCAMVKAHCAPLMHCLISCGFRINVRA